MSKKKVVIIGYGEMGHAFEHLLSAHAELSIWTRGNEKAGLGDLSALVLNSSFAILCLPVVAHAVIAERLAQCLPAEAICISIAKGLDDQGRPALPIMSDNLPRHRHVLLYGPMISEEICIGRAAFAQLATTDTTAARAVAELFKQTPLYLRETRDMIGISWAVILKNVYAILFGVADELALGDNVRGFLMTQSLTELSAILQLKGGKAKSAFGLAGLGDLTTTATSESSHHHGLGRCLARNDCAAINGEGVHTLQMVLKHQLLPVERFPLFGLCRDVLSAAEQSRILFDDYLKNNAGSR